ncbi:MAG TPA: KipI antagonist, partial [Nitrospira sp.]|nr:KipI antagonist [Nitrospira sp.]
MPSGERGEIHVVKPGLCTTLQDLGRQGFQHYGLSVSGAMDRRSLIVANRLVGNHDADAALEMTLTGSELLFESATIVAVTGADLSPSVDGCSLPQWTSVEIRAGSRLVFGRRRAGARAYLAVAGGFDAPVVWGSRSTHLASATGGL